MDCQAAQNELLSAESLNLLAPELSAHIAECPECQALLAKLRKLDMDTRALPVPGGHEQPSPEFLRSVTAAAGRSGRATNRFLRRVIAAAVVLAFMLAAISLIFFNGSTVQADVLIGDLVDWNLSIAHVHDMLGRTRVYQQQLQQLDNLMNKSKLAPADAALAHSLMSNAQWLTTENNASAESQRFQTIANELLIRRQAASDGAGEHLQQIYQQLINQGVNGGNGSATSPAATPRNVAPAGTSPSSALPGNSNLMPLALQTKQVPAATPSGKPVAENNIHEDGSPAFSDSGDILALSTSRMFSTSDAGSTHFEMAHWHHSISHSSGGGGATNTDSSHGNATTANSPTAQLPSRSSTEVQTHPVDNSQASAEMAPPPPPPPPPPSNQADSSPPPRTWSDQAPPDLGAVAGMTLPTRLAALQDVMGWHFVISPGQLPPRFDMDSLIAADGITMPPMLLGGIGISRREIDLSLAEHIRDSWQGATEWSSSTPPPPIGLGNWNFDHANDFAHPIEFPEPTITGFLFLLPLATRRRRR